MSRNFFRGRCNLVQGSKSINIYTDGACPRNGQPGARGGVGVYSEDPRVQVSRPLGDGRQTNQRAEIEAARAGIEAAKNAGYNNINVHTDSAYVTKGMNEWRGNWHRNDYAGVQNREDFQNLERSMEGAKVTFQHIPRERNEAADQLAREGASRE